MLSARELADATAQLEEYRLQSDRYAQTQSEILDKYRGSCTREWPDTTSDDS